MEEKTLAELRIEREELLASKGLSRNVKRVELARLDEEIKKRVVATLERRPQVCVATGQS